MEYQCGTKMEGDILISASNYRSRQEKNYKLIISLKKKKRKRRNNSMQHYYDEILFKPALHYDSDQCEYYRGTDRIEYKAINNGNNNSLITTRRTLNSNDVSV